jgi:alkylation response protein AidB-like acyl-CoA dehydrogenase
VKLGKINEPVLRQDLMKLYSEETTKSPRRDAHPRRDEGRQGPRSRRVARQAARGQDREACSARSPATVHGADAIAYDGDDKMAMLSRSILTSFSANIAGGSDEIQKNIIGDRVLGLPRDIAVDTKVPFKDLKVGTQRSAE